MLDFVQCFYVNSSKFFTKNEFLKNSVYIYIKCQGDFGILKKTLTRKTKMGLICPLG